MKKLLSITGILFITLTAQAQDSVYARKMLDTLTSKYFWGRGYTNDGMGKARQFIVGQFKQMGLKPLDGKDFVQQFTYNVNTFPGKMEVSLNGKLLQPGRDYIINPESRAVSGSGQLYQKDSVTFTDPVNRVMVSLKNKLTWSVSQVEMNYTGIQIDRKVVTEAPTNIKIAVESNFIENFKTGNICAIVPGTSKPDSILMFTAHYDHLGGMGDKTFFPGANDNASGISMLLSLAKYYAKHPQKYSIAFMCFAGEEAGILGSRYFTENPLIPLNRIKFLVNMDIMGTGDEGITVVNATVYPKAFALLQKINTDQHLLPKVVSRGKAANSDHYFFTEKGVPAVFIYTMGGIKAYHDVFDVSRTLPLSKYNSLFKLLTGFAGAMQE